MKKHILPPFLTSIFLTVSLAGAQEQNPTLTIDAGAPAAKVNPLHYGLMTEEINHSYDGGLYAELIRNRAFLDDARTPAHWTAVQSGGSNAKIALDSSQSLNSALTTSLRLDVSVASAKEPAGFANDGYWGIPVKPNTSYHSSFYAKAAPGFSGPVTLTIESTDGKTIYASASVSSLTADWKQYTATLKTGRVALTSNTRFAVKVQHSGTAWFSLVSLFPPTYKNRPNGLRPDLMQMLVDLKPAFLRFPGGNYVEGGTIATRFDWKKTIGPVVERPGHPCPWGYRSTDGMGLLEFLLWCEDMGAEPVLAVYAGYSLGGERALPGAALDPFVKEALEEIEYVSGSVKTKWGAQRAKDGHPRPFKLQYVEVGNEDFFDRSGSYDARFAQFYDAIKKSYPSLKVASTVGNEQPADKRVKSRRAEVLDEHYYRSVAQFLKDSPTYYDRYPRDGQEIFVGEWGAYEDVAPWDPRSRTLPPTPGMKAALGDAAWMIGMERNADLVVMQCYAPLLVNVNPGGRQWRPNLIGYNALDTFGSPSYYAFQIFSRNHGDVILKASMTGAPLHSSVTMDSKTGAVYVKYLNPEASAQTVKINLKGMSLISSTGTAIVIAADPSDSNSIDAPTKILPVNRSVGGLGSTFTYTFPANSITVLRLETRATYSDNFTIGDPK